IDQFISEFHMQVAPYDEQEECHAPEIQMVDAVAVEEPVPVYQGVAERLDEIGERVEIRHHLQQSAALPRLPEDRCEEEAHPDEVLQHIPEVAHQYDERAHHQRDREDQRK